MAEQRYLCTYYEINIRASLGSINKLAGCGNSIEITYETVEMTCQDIRWRSG